MFNSRAAAEPLQKRLVEAGIRAEIHDELRLEKFWFVSKPETGVRIELPADQYERAYELLMEWDKKEGLLREAIRCPECGSLRVEYPQFTRKFLIPNLAMGLLAAIHAVEKEFYCQECHFTWPKEGTRLRPDRAHMSPYYFIDGIEQTRLEQTRPEPAQKAA
jgi:hypothetical protein